MSADPFQVVGDSLSGHGLVFDVAFLVSLEPGERRTKLVEIAEVSYRVGRTSALLSLDDRFDVHAAIDVLRALAVVVGPTTGERHRRAADVLERLLHDQEEGA